jgi:hypothetical protein
MGRHVVTTVSELIPEQLRERIIRKLRLLKADNVGPALVQPRQETRHALLERVHVPGGDAHRPHGIGSQICPDSEKAR